jgi:hypothetical protein
MSTLVAQTISNGTVSTSTANVINGAKAWVNFNGTGTVAIRASYNVSSITDNGTGSYTVNFTNAFADANYAGVAMIRADTDYAPTVGQPHSLASQTASQLSLKTGAYNSAQDSTVVTVAVFR